MASWTLLPGTAWSLRPACNPHVFWRKVLPAGRMQLTPMKSTIHLGKSPSQEPRGVHTDVIRLVNSADVAAARQVDHFWAVPRDQSDH